MVSAKATELRAIFCFPVRFPLPAVKQHLKMWLQRYGGWRSARSLSMPACVAARRHLGGSACALAAETAPGLRTSGDFSTPAEDTVCVLTFPSSSSSSPLCGAFASCRARWAAVRGPWPDLFRDSAQGPSPPGQLPRGCGQLAAPPRAARTRPSSPLRVIVSCSAGFAQSGLNRSCCARACRRATGTGWSSAW